MPVWRWLFMALDILKGRKCMVWTFMGNTRMYTALKNYGDRLSQVGLFSFKVDATGTITESGVAISDMLTHINMWPHITWLLTVRNDGTSSVFTVLRENTDGAQKHFTESRLWWPYWRSTFWASLADGISLSAGTHTITVSVDVKGVQFYGFRVCSNFSEEPSAGSASFTLSPRHFIDVDGNKCQPDKGFKLTCEMLLRKPDSALIWYEDFQDTDILETNYWKTLSGSWKVWRQDEYSDSRIYSQLEGSGQFAWNYDGFSDIHLRVRFAFPSGSTARLAFSAATCSAA